MSDRFIIAAGAALFGAYLFKNAFCKSQNVRLISDAAACRNALKQIRQHCSDYPVLAFDCQRASGGQAIALIQLQSHQGLCLLIRLPRVGMTRELRELLTNERIVKVGVGVNLLARQLLDDHRVRCKGMFDLRYMAALAKRQPDTLFKMSKDYLEINFDKESTLTFNWDTSDLSKEALEYAAKGVDVNISLFKRFEGLIYDGWWYRSSSGRVRYVIDKFCSKFLDFDYNGSQGIPHEFIRGRMLED